MNVDFLWKKKLIFFASALALVTIALVYHYARPALAHFAPDLEYIETSSSKLSVRDLGEGGPVVIIIHGMSRHKDEYIDLHKTISEYTRVISYDRPGLGLSNNNALPKTLNYMARDLAELLQAKNLEEPVILIGHSAGGLLIRYYADLYPTRVSGLIFLDQPHENWFRYVRDSWSQEEVEQYFKWWSLEGTSYKGAAKEEMLNFEANGDMVRGLELDPNTPVLMFTASSRFHYRKSDNHFSVDQSMWSELQNSLLSNSQDSRHIVDVEMGHWPHHSKPELVSEEIIQFIEKVKASAVEEEAN